MPLKHLTPTQWDAVDAGTPDQETREHLATCEECRAVVAESRALLVGLRRTGHTQEPGQPLATDHPAAEDLAAYGDGVLFGAGARSIEEHLEHCSDCRDDIIVMRDIAAAGDAEGDGVSRGSRSVAGAAVARASARAGDISRSMARQGQPEVGALFSPLVLEGGECRRRVGRPAATLEAYQADWHERAIGVGEGTRSLHVRGRAGANDDGPRDREDAKAIVADRAGYSGYW